MIKPLNTPQLTATKTRTGLQSISDLLPRLIRNYELQAEMMHRREQESVPMPVVIADASTVTQQATFGWYE